MKKVIFPVLVLAFYLVPEQAKADFTFGEMVNLKSVIPVIDPDYDTIDCFSYDGLEIYLESVRPGGSSSCDIWVLKRDSIHDDWGMPENLGHGVNSPKDEAHASISGDGLTLYFTSDQPGGYGDFDIWMATRSSKNDPWGEAVNMGPKINSNSWDISPWVSADGLEFYFCSSRSGGYGGLDIYLIKRSTMNDPWDQPENLGPVVNSSYNEVNVHLSPDSLLLLFSELMGETPRPGGYGGTDIWMARRASISAPWESPSNLGSQVNGSVHDKAPCISIDGSMLYLTTITYDDIWDNWQVPILHIVDLNGDGIVNADDMCIMVDNWGTDNQLCDIGPMPWGDGVVDIQDLIVLAEHLFEEFPPAEPAE
jgi:Tol biopolymer transport system component